MAFDFGKFFVQKDIWQQHINLVRDRGGHVPTFVNQAVVNAGIDPFHKDFTNLKRRNVKFRGRVYETFDQIANAQIKNSPTIYEFKDEVLMEINRLETRRGIRFISEREATAVGSIVSPIQWHRAHRSDGKLKCRFIIHCKLNPFYSRPRFSLADIADEVHVIAKFEELVVADNEDAFYSGVAYLIMTDNRAYL